MLTRLLERSDVEALQSQAVALLDQHWDIDAIARELSVHRSFVLWLLRRANGQYTIATRREMVKTLFQKGITPREIAAELRERVHTVWADLRILGITN